MGSCATTHTHTLPKIGAHMTAFPTSGFLSEASDGLREMLSAQATEISLSQGEILFEQGDEGDSLYAILEGTLEVSFLAMSGRKLTLTLMRPGEVFGEIALFDNGPRTATIAAAEQSRVLRVRRNDVMNQIRQQPDLAVDMIRLAGLRMRWMGLQLNEQVFLPHAHSAGPQAAAPVQFTGRPVRAHHPVAERTGRVCRSHTRGSIQNNLDLETRQHG